MNRSSENSPGFSTREEDICGNNSCAFYLWDFKILQFFFLNTALSMQMVSAHWLSVPTSSEPHACLLSPGSLLAKSLLLLRHFTVEPAPLLLQSLLLLLQLLLVPVQREPFKGSLKQVISILGLIQRYRKHKAKDFLNWEEK